MVITYGKAFFSKSENHRTQKKKLIFYPAPDECKRRIVKTEDDASDVEMGPTVSDDSICVDVDAEVNKATDGNSENEINVLDRDGEGELDLDVPQTGDAGGIGVEEGTDPKEINEDTNVFTDNAPGPSPMMANACPSPVQVPDDKSTPETFHTTTEINGLGGNPPLRVTAPYPTAPSLPTTNIDGGNHLFPGVSPTAPTMEIDGANANPFTLPLSHCDPGHPARFNFPEETHGPRIQSNPYSFDFSLTSASPVHSATPSLNPSELTDLWFRNHDAEYNHSALSTNLSFPQGAQL